MSQSNNSELKLGSIGEIWKSREEWLKYCQYLDKMTPEGFDSDGLPVKLSRYAVFLKLYVELYQREMHFTEMETSRGQLIDRTFKNPSND